MHSHGPEIDPETGKPLDKSMVARITRNKDWLPLGAALTEHVNTWAGSRDLVLYIGQDGAADLGEERATAFYDPTKREIEISAPYAFGKGITADRVDAVKAATKKGLVDYPVLGGLCMHESMHAKHSTWFGPDMAKAFLAKFGPNIGQQLPKIYTLLEETRIESRGVREWPKDAGFLRASARKLTEPPPAKPGEPQGDINLVQAIVLVLGRGPIGVLTKRDLSKLRKEVIAQMNRDGKPGTDGVAVLSEIEGYAAIFHKTNDGSPEGREVLMSMTKHVYDLLSQFMPQVEMEWDGFGDDPSEQKSNESEDSDGLGEDEKAEGESGGDESGEDEGDGSGDGEGEDGKGEEEGEGSGSPSAGGEPGEGKPQSGGQPGSGKSKPQQVGTPDGRASQGQMVPGTEQNGQLSDEAGSAMEDAMNSAEIGGADDVWNEEAKAEAERQAKEAEKKAEEQKENDIKSKNTFERSSGANGRTKSRIVSRREPTDVERRAMVSFNAALEDAKYRDRKMGIRQDYVPPGRLQTSGAMRDEAIRWSGGVGGSVTMFKGKRRTHVDQPDLTVGVIKDISGSMSGTMEQMAVADWILANSVNRIEGSTVASLCFGESVFPTLWPGDTLDQVTRYNANDSFEEFNAAFQAIDGKLKLLTGSGVRLLVVVSDGNYRPHEERACRKWLAECQNAGVGVLWLGLKHGRAESYIEEMGSGGAFVHVGDGVTEAIDAISGAALTALRGY